MIPWSSVLDKVFVGINRSALALLLVFHSPWQAAKEKKNNALSMVSRYTLRSHLIHHSLLQHVKYNNNNNNKNYNKTIFKNNFFVIKIRKLFF